MEGRTIRRVVTGYDEQGRSIFVSDGPSPRSLSIAGGTKLTDLWEANSVPISNAGNEDAVKATPLSLNPPRNGFVVRAVEFMPDTEASDEEVKASFADMQAAEAHDEEARHAGMHKTPTLDCIFVVEGEIYALMDIGETLLKAGDVLLQRGTNHAFANRSDKPALLVGILVDAEPL